MQLQNIQITGGLTFIPEILTPTGDPYWANVSLLMNTTSTNNQNNNVFLDSSTNNFTVTRNGTVTQGSFTPFTVAPNTSYNPSVNGGSGYFNGAGSYLTAPSDAAFNFGTGNFTIEAWCYFNNPTQNSTNNIFANYAAWAAGDVYLGKHSASGSGKVSFWVNNYNNATPLLTDPNFPPSGQWVHYAVCRQGNDFTLYRDGVSVSTGTSSVALTTTNKPASVGATMDGQNSFNGYMVSVRIVKGTAVYTSAFTPPTAPLTAIANTSLLLNFTNAGIFDNATKNNLTTIGDAKVSTTQSKFAPTSVVFDGTGDRLETLNVSPLRAEIASDFTAEMWVYPVANQQFAFYMGFNTSTVAGSWRIRIENFVLNGVIGDVGILQGSVSVNQWSHIALTKSGATARLFLNGVLQGSATITTISAGSMNFTIGDWADTGRGFNGFVQDVRITKGVARYTAAFTPPTAPFPTN